MKTYRVGIDLRAENPNFKAHFGRGTGRYVSNLSKALLNLTKDSKKISIQGLSTQNLTQSSFERTFLKLAPFGKNTIRDHFFMPYNYKKENVDLIHFFSHPDASPFLLNPYIVTVLDLIPLKFKELYKANKPNWRFKFGRYLEELSIKRAKKILAISEATKKDLIELLGVNEEKIKVTELAADISFSPKLESEKKLEDYKKEVSLELGLDSNREFLLYVGGIDPRKNVLFLLEVFSELLKELDHKPLLLLVGRYFKDDNYPALLKKIRELKIENHVKEMGFLDEDYLLKLYQVSTLFLFPSLYEGFGLPVLEAMSSGLSVVANNNSSIPEVCGDAFSLLETNNKNMWVKEILTLLKDKDLRKRRSLSSLKRAKMFGWEKTAKKTLEAYKELLF